MTCLRSRFLLWVALLVSLPVLAGDVAPAPQGREELHVGPSAAALSIADIHNSAAKLSSLNAVGPLTVEERARLTRKDASDLRARVGIVRDLGRGVMLDLAAADIPRDLPAAIAGGLLEQRSDDYVWTAGFSSEGAGALRLNIRNAILPRSARIYVYSSTGEVHGPYFGDQMTPSFWTNTVFSDQVFVEVQFSVAGSERLRLEIGSLLHVEHPGFAPHGRPITIEGIEQYACFLTSTCVPSGELSATVLNDRARGIAAMVFISADDGNAYVCTGGLLNDNDESTTVPYFLTANHCISRQSEANTLELFWDYKYATCGGPAPNKASMPRQMGATLLATSSKGTAGADFTFLRLNSTPPGSRWYLGWDSSDIRRSANITTYRLHHPDGEPLHYSRQSTLGDGLQGYDGYIFSGMSIGANYGGSSGSPVFRYSSATGAQVVGNLSGSNAATQQDLESYCNYDKYIVRDGAFSQAYPQIAQWLAGSGVPPQPAPCVASPTQICLVGNRFQVIVKYNDGSGLKTMQAIKYTANSGLFWFTDNSNIEVLLKMIDACGFNKRFWVYAGGTTDVEVNITVTDTQTGIVKSWTNPRGTKFGTITASDAFATCQ